MIPTQNKLEKFWKTKHFHANFLFDLQEFVLIVYDSKRNMHLNVTIIHI